MINIIVTGHGKFAEGLLAASEVILGKQENVSEIEFLSEDSSEDLQVKLEKEVKKYGDNILFITDLVGGTPFNLSVIQAQQLNNSRVIGGSSLPMLMEIIINRNTENIDELVEQGLNTGKNAMMVFKARD